MSAVAAFFRCSVCRARVADCDLQPPVFEESTCVGTPEQPHPPQQMVLVVTGTGSELAADLDDVVAELRAAVNPVLLRIADVLLAVAAWRDRRRAAVPPARPRPTPREDTPR